MPVLSNRKTGGGGGGQKDEVTCLKSQSEKQSQDLRADLCSLP